MEKVTASASCWNELVVTGSAAEEVAEFIILSAKSICRLMLLEAAHTSDASFDPAMVLFKSIGDDAVTVYTTLDYVDAAKRFGTMIRRWKLEVDAEIAEGE